MSPFLPVYFMIEIPEVVLARCVQAHIASSPEPDAETAVLLSPASHVQAQYVLPELLISPDAPAPVKARVPLSLEIPNVTPSDSVSSAPLSNVARPLLPPQTAS